MLPEGRIIGALQFWQGNLAALTDHAIFLLHPETLEIRGRIGLNHAGRLQMRRKPLLGGPEGPLWVVSTRAIWKIAKPDAQAVLFCRSGRKITGGIGIRSGYLYFLRAAEVCRIKL